MSPGVSLQNANTLLSAFAIVNTGAKRKDNVKITSITLAGARLTVPAFLPFDLGTLLPNGSAILDADFAGGPFLPSTSYALTIRGTYAHEHERRCFKLKASLSVPPAAPGSAPLQTATVGSNTVKGGPFPHQPLDFENDVNSSGWTVPTGPFVPGIPTPTATSPQAAPIGDPPHVHQPLIETIVAELNGQGQCPSTGASAARTAWVMDEILGEFRAASA